ncbi:MAG: DUF3187 family protein [Desulfuromonadia bacterium]
MRPATPLFRDIGRLLGALLLLLLLSPPAEGGESTTPFPTVMQGALQLPFGLPPPDGGRILPPGVTRAGISTDIASTYLFHDTPREFLLLDGESRMVTLRLRRGTAWGEMGVDIPWIGVGGGSFDSFIIGWHDFFGLPQGGRDAAPRNRFRYIYLKNGSKQVYLTEPSSGIGDIRLTAGYRLRGDENSPLSLRGVISLPTGDPDRLRGSGTPSLSLALAGEEGEGALGIWGVVGGSISGSGEILPGMGEQVVGFARLGCGWSPRPPLTFKLELLGTTPLYRGSTMTAISGYPLILVMGGSISLSESTVIDIGVTEDINLESGPDVALHAGVRYIF